MRTVFSRQRRLFSGALGFQPKDVFNIGFLGAGDISNLHAAAVNKCDGARLAGIWNRPECPVADLDQKAAEYGCDAFKTAEELVEYPGIDAVYVLTNMETHLEYAKLAMQAGKHVLVEKPVGASIAEIEEMIRLADLYNVLCIPGHNYIHETNIKRIRDLIDKEKLGEITQLYIMYNIYHPEDVCSRLPGIIRQILTHHGYLTLYLLKEALGMPVAVSALKGVIKDGAAYKLPLENLAHVSLQFENGALAHLQASFANDDHSSAPWSFVVKAMGTKGVANYNYNDFVENQQHIVHSHTYSAYPYAIEEQTQYFVNQILRRGALPMSSMEDAITCQKIIEASEQSIMERRQVDL